MKKCISLNLVFIILLSLITINFQKPLVVYAHQDEKDFEFNGNKFEKEVAASENFHNPINDFNNKVNIPSETEKLIYQSLIKELKNEEYFIENVETIYFSPEYLNELKSNSMSNIFFGYTEKELINQFQGKRYNFTLDQYGNTTVTQLTSTDLSENDIYYQIIQNVAVGTGVILGCAVLSSATSGTAVSIIFAFSAKTGAVSAVSAAGVGGMTAGIIKAFQTGDPVASLKTAALTASEEFKFSAIIGSITGGVAKGFELKRATLWGLNLNEAAQIQKETSLPVDIISDFKSMDEFNIIKKNGTKFFNMENGKAVLFPDNINLSKNNPDGLRNLGLMAKGMAPLDSSGKPFELHHVGQRAQSTLAVLNSDVHHNPANYKFLHYADAGKEISAAEWNYQRQKIWKLFYEKIMSNEIMVN